MSKIEPRPTAAQRAARAGATDALHTATKGLDGVDVCTAVETLLKARPDVSPRDLEDLGNRIQRYAWQLEREEVVRAHL